MKMMKANALVLVLVAVVMLVRSPIAASLEDDQTRHHVVGEDRGWDLSSNVPSWASRKVFRVGDSIWFVYSAAKEMVAELGSKEEFETCDVSNPIKMYTDGLNNVRLDGEGSRYFVSGMPESCKNGLKLHVHVEPLPQQELTESKTPMSTTTVMAAAPAPPPSTASDLPIQLSTMLLAGLALHLCYLAF